MQMEWDTHFKEIVVAAWQAYLSAERQLSNASEHTDEKMKDQAAFNALREGGAACIYLNHFAEVLFRARPDWLPTQIQSAVDLTKLASENCSNLRGEAKSDDVALLGDVADALKHSVLTRSLEKRQITSSDQVLVVASGYGVLRYGEGKFGGTKQVLVLTRSGPRALSSILQNVVDAWRRLLGFVLPDVGEP